jgi:hypothetical protein
VRIKVSKEVKDGREKGGKDGWGGKVVKVDNREIKGGKDFRDHKGGRDERGF